MYGMNVWHVAAISQLTMKSNVVKQEPRALSRISQYAFWTPTKEVKRLCYDMRQSVGHIKVEVWSHLG